MSADWSWYLRRAAVRLAGEGPRARASLRSFARPEVDQPGGRFQAPASVLVLPSLSGEVRNWPAVECCEPSRTVYLLSKAGLYDNNGVVYDVATRRAFDETLRCWDRPAAHNPALGKPRLHPPQDLGGLSVFLGGLGGQTFYHFLVETLPQISVLRPWIERAERVIVQDYLEPVKIAWLRRAGLDKPVTWLAALDHFRCEQLAFCLPLVADCRPGPWVVSRVRDLVGARPLNTVAPPRRHRCLWLGRLGAHVRPVAWEPALVASLPPPWEAVELSGLSPERIVALGAECACVAGLHGAAFANLAVWEPGIRVLEFYPEPKNAWYPSLSLSAGHHHAVRHLSTSESLETLRDELARFARALPLPGRDP